MNTTTAVISPQAAPRSIEELSKIGIFRLRLLIDQLGGLRTPEQKQAFAGLTAEEKVGLAVQLLATWDSQNVGASQIPSPQRVGGGDSIGGPTPISAAMARTSLIPRNAPRSIEELSELGVFRLRVLLENLGALRTHNQKQKFASLNIKEKVLLAARSLARWDKRLAPRGAKRSRSRAPAGKAKGGRG